jgi:hypothetical protein
MKTYMLMKMTLKISNRWNYKFQSMEQRHKERNQLKYVSYTRASKKLQIVV